MGLEMADVTSQHEIPSDDARSIERRRFLRTAAIAAWASPMIVSMAASPANAQTVSCVPPGRECSPNGLPCCHDNHQCRLTGSGYRCVGPPPPDDDSDDHGGGRDTSDTDSGEDNNGNDDTDDTDTSEDGD